MPDYAMPPETARTLIESLQRNGVDACVGGGWAVDALVGRQTRTHADLDLWVDATDFEPLVATFATEGVDRLHPWPGDRPWNFVLHDGTTRRVDLHLYERLPDDRLHYGSVNTPFLFTPEDLSGRGEIAALPVRCEHPDFALQNHTGYPLREVDHHDIAILRERFNL
ncbi:nucleotidyltransferase domain-containing protein [Kribbella sp. NPDC059898]|uniref:nucleotidyltransferase domain-containing protein n=1 Tax=Kribbella sp. NPDC059898 TaxID=3346995 RepID=UPI003666CF9E